MNGVKRAAAVAELLLIFPAALFMAALVVRNMQPLRYELAGTAQRIVMWYAGRQWTLWALLIGLPLAVLVTGCAVLPGWHRERPNGTRRTQPATLLVAATTFTAGVILLIVVRHMLAN